MMTAHGGDGGPAFPTGDGYKVDDVSICNMHGGMSLRDWFAGQALAGWNANSCADITSEEAARFSYADADAMIKARNEVTSDN